MFDLLGSYGRAGTVRPHQRLQAEWVAGCHGRQEFGNAERGIGYLAGTSSKLAQPFGAAPMGPHEASAAGDRSRILKFWWSGSQKSGSPTSVSTEGRDP